MIACPTAEAARPTGAESTRIGLQTCRKVIRQMGGEFEIHQEARRFLAEITLPLCPESPALPQGKAE